MTVLTDSIGDLLHSLGDIPAGRVRMRPYPGTATVDDVVAIERNENRLFELIDGVLVEKVMGFRESIVAIALARYLEAFVTEKKLGVVAGADGMVQIFTGMVRMPDVAFVSLSRLPGGKVPLEPVPHLVPDLAVEVISASNTAGEMDRKREEYFRAGVRLVWEINLEKRSAIVYTSLENKTHLDATQSLVGGEVIPNFSVGLSSLFARLD